MSEYRGGGSCSYGYFSVVVFALPLSSPVASLESTRRHKALVPAGAYVGLDGCLPVPSFTAIKLLVNSAVVGQEICFEALGG